VKSSTVVARIFLLGSVAVGVKKAEFTFAKPPLPSTFLGVRSFSSMLYRGQQLTMTSLRHSVS